MSLGRAVAWQFLRGNAGQEISSRERKVPSGVPPGARGLPWLEVDRHTQLQPMSGLPLLQAWGPTLAVSVTWGACKHWCPGSAERLLVNGPWGLEGICVSGTLAQMCEQKLGHGSSFFLL